MRKADIVIIGGGVIGASVAYHLAEHGAKNILVLDRAAHSGAGSTGVATGGIRAQFETVINIKMSLYSLGFFKDWEFDCEYEPAGYLFFATTDEQLAYLKKSGETQKALGVKGLRMLDQDDVRSLVPILECDDIRGGSFCSNDGFINPLAVLGGFTQGAKRNGVRFEYGTDVLRIGLTGDKVSAVEIAGGRIECKTAIVCAGAWARSIAATVNIDLPVEPQRRQIVWARSADVLPPGLPMVIDIGTGFHFRPARDFTTVVSERATDSRDVLFAYPDPEELPSCNVTFDDAFIDKVYERAKLRSQFLSRTEVTRQRCRAGLYENTPDHHAILGGCEITGLYFANGFSGHGVMHSPAAGRAVSEIVLNGRAESLDVSLLSLDRFKKGELLHETAFI